MVVIILLALGLAAPIAQAQDNSAPAAVETSPAAADAPKTKEEQLGEKAAAELEKSFKLIEEPPQLPQLFRIVNTLAPLTERPEVRYSIKVIDSGAINAISLPGGKLYITAGAINAVESEDELAAILAHEIAHNSLRHAMEQQARANRTDLGLIAGIIGGILSNRGEVALMAAQIQQGALNHYGREAEMAADRHAVDYLRKADYKPTAMLTVLEGLAAIEETRPQYEVITTAHTHPVARERARALEQLLKQMGINVTAERRQVTNRFVVEAKPLQIEETTIAEVRLNDKRVFAPAAKLGDDTPLARAQKYAAALQQAFAEGIQLVDLSIQEADGSYRLVARGAVLVEITEADADYHKRYAKELAQEAEKVVELALYAEQVSRPF